MRTRPSSGRATSARASSSRRSPPPSAWGAAGAASGRSCSPPARGVLLAALATARVRLTLARSSARARSRCWRGACSPRSRPTALGIDHRGLLSIVGAGDHTALNLKLHHGIRYPLTHARADRRRRRAGGAGRRAAWRATSAARAGATRRSVPTRLDEAFGAVQLLADDHVAGARLVVGVGQPGVEARPARCRRSSRRCTGA